MLDNTILIYTTDHGWTDKGYPYEGSSLVPLIFHWPSRVDPFPSHPSSGGAGRGRASSAQGRGGGEGSNRQRRRLQFRQKATHNTAAVVAGAVVTLVPVQVVAAVVPIGSLCLASLWIA